MPGVDRECVTHHCACDCREAVHAKLVADLRAENAVLLQRYRADYQRALCYWGEILRLHAAAGTVPALAMDVLDSGRAEVERLRAELNNAKLLESALVEMTKERDAALRELETSV